MLINFYQCICNDKAKIWLKIAKGACVAPHTLLSPCRGLCESAAGT